MWRLRNWPTRWQTEVKAGNVGKTLTALKTASEVVTVASTLAQMKVETAGKTLSDVEAQALLDTLSAPL